MKNLILVLGLFFIISSCEVQGELTNDKVDNPAVLPSTASKLSGEFISSPGESISGSAKIYLEKDHQLILENVMASGPDLKVYLSKSDKPVDFVNLGNFIKSKTVYEIPATIDVQAYKYVIVYCQQYSVIFGVASLTKS
ncbi:DM13 domain-containing protein [Flavobacterium sp. 5]|uniref:DM13 domain-containing protein n=1 Tax=Flavobacterium sp. 5 TaxID=2035199 RepID=UPI000C2C2587|nr:DM13 domain-containing protein [Flavobacterium sp. 5]PKB17312.1 electron transfer DM13 [Flavobacterium sp. 5]